MEAANRPSITLDLKKGRIRIHSSTLHLLGAPAYIELLVNPEKRILAVRSSGQKHPLAHKMYYGSQRDNELYSDMLLKRLSRLYSQMQGSGTYRIHGTHYPDQNLVVFEMRNMFLINEPLTKEAPYECE